MHVDRFAGELFSGPDGPSGARRRAETQNPPETTRQRRIQLLASAMKHGGRIADGVEPEVAVRAEAIAKEK